ncbi:unnamed protein product [Ascophyllum nodosum]
MYDVTTLREFMGREDGGMNKYRGSRHTRGKSEAALVIPGLPAAWV